ncbi:MAG: 50S ribosomal protein L10 [Candidatus Micrarchaeota archaeon]
MVTKQQKKDAVSKIKADLKKYPIVAIASNASLPSRQYNLIMKKTRGHAKFDISRHTLLIKALEEARPEAKELTKYLGNSGLILLSDLPAFKLFQLFKQNKSKAAAKPGAIAPNDIVIPAGETNLAPGPVLTELKMAKIDAKIQGPKVVIVRDALVAKKGEPISEPVAKILSKLGIEPFEIGLDIKAVWDNGILYPGDLLDIDTDAFKMQLVQAHQAAVNLGVFAGIHNSVTTPLMVQKAAREANALSKMVAGKQAASVEKPVEAKVAEPTTEPSSS